MIFIFSCSKDDNSNQNINCDIVGKYATFGYGFNDSLIIFASNAIEFRENKKFFR
jgi:hypothetical protein